MALYTSDAKLTIQKIEVGETADLKGALSMAAVPENAAAFSGVTTMATALFHQTGAKVGSAMMF